MQTSASNSIDSPLELIAAIFTDLALPLSIFDILYFSNPVRPID